MKSLVVVPAYNEGQNIRQVLVALPETSATFDVLVIDDCSTDNTADVVAELGIPQIRLPCNLGYARAVQTGLRYAVNHEYDAVVLIDADGQHNPNVIPSMLEPLKRGEVDLTVGSRFVHGGSYRASFGRAIGIKLFSHLASFLLKQKVTDTSSGCKAMHIGVARALIASHFVDFHAEALVYVTRLGYGVREVPIIVGNRAQGSSMYSPLSFVTYPLQTILLMLVAVWEASQHRSEEFNR